MEGAILAGGALCLPGGDVGCLLVHGFTETREAAHGEYLWLPWSDRG